jgi:hypothetical protein
VRGSVQHFGAHVRRAVTYNQHVQVGSKRRQCCLGRGVTGRRPTEARCQVKGLEAPLGHGLESLDVERVDVGVADILAAGEADKWSGGVAVPDRLRPTYAPAPAVPGARSAHLMATEPSSRKAGWARSGGCDGCVATPASSISMPRPGRSGANR